MSENIQNNIFGSIEDGKHDHKNLYTMFERIPIHKNNLLKKTCSILEKGGIIAYPTDTIYGFGCDALNEDAIKRLNSIKQRSSPMSVLCQNIETMLSWVRLPNHQKINAKNKLQPGVTIIAPVKNNIVSKLVMGNKNTLGIRIPDQDFCIDLASKYSNPITTTSVNRSGNKPHSDPREIELEFSNEIDLCIDAGIIEGRGSKIYKYENSSWSIIRS